MASLSLKNIYKVYPNGTKAVNDFCMDIEDKEFIVFVGPSGCGKSTVLRMIAGLEEISAGELKIGDRVVNDVECKSRDTAMVFQNYALYPHMTVADNMAFPLKMIKLTKEQKEDLRRRADEKYPRKSGQAPVLAEGEKKGIFNNPFCNTVLRPLRVWQTRREDTYKTVIKIAEILGLEEYLGKKPGAMSGGQRQRVALGRAMVRNPQVFLLDEPLSNLDAKLRTQMRSEITKLHNRVQTTFIYVTHDQVEAMTMGDRIVVMKKGTIQQIDTPINLYSYPANMFVAGFIGTPSMNFFDAVVENDGKASVTFAGGKKLEFSSEYIKKIERKYFGKDVVMGVRPEDFILSDEGVECAVLSTEMLGSETLLYCDFDTENVTNYDAGKFPLIIKIDGVCARKCGDIIKVSINFDKMHFFDKGSEESVMKRFVSYNEIPVKAERGKLAIGGISATLPPVLFNLEGELTAIFPTDAICKGESYEAEVLECEKLKEGWLARLNIGSEKLYALFNEEVTGSIKVDVLWNKVTFSKGETVVKEALKTDNVFNIKLEKRALSGARKKALPEDEKRAFDVDIVCGETKLTCPVSVLKRLLSASDRKLFGVDMQLIFGENAVNAENTFAAKVVEKYDYGHGKYAKCRCLDTDIILPYESGEEIKFGIDLTKASVYDVALGIKIT